MAIKSTEHSNGNELIFFLSLVFFVFS